LTTTILSLQKMFEETQSDVELDRFIIAIEHGVELTPVSRPEYKNYIIFLMNALRDRFSRKKIPEDLDRVITKNSLIYIRTIVVYLARSPGFNLLDSN